MRVLLFRGKAIKTGAWVYGSACPHDGDRCSILYQSPTDGGLDGDEVDPETVGQYTGLRDKSGLMIFEGDIVKFDQSMGIRDANEPFVILYGSAEDPLNRETAFAAFDSHGGRLGVCIMWWETDMMKVIGNIHNNPELMKLKREG